MNESKIAVRYAKALFQLSAEKKLLELVYSDMETVAKIVKESELFCFFYFNPVNKPSLKISTLDQIFGNNKLHPITLDFLKLLIHKNRFNYITDISRCFVDIYKKYKGIKTAGFQSVFEPDAEIKKRISDILKNFYESEIELQVNINSELIGGFILRVEDHQYDASVATALKKMKTALKE